MKCSNASIKVKSKRGLRVSFHCHPHSLEFDLKSGALMGMFKVKVRRKVKDLVAFFLNHTYKGKSEEQLPPPTVS